MPRKPSSTGSERTSQNAAARTAVVLLVGADEFLKRDWLFRFREDRRKEHGSCDLISYGKEEGPVQPAAIFDELRTGSLFGGFKVLSVDPADDFVRQHASLIMSYMAAPAPSAALILSASARPADKKLDKRLRGADAVVVLAPARRGELVRWVIERATQYGKQIESAPAALLAERLGEKPGLLDAALQRLAQHVGDHARITTDDVDAAVRDERERARYELSAAIARGDTRAALVALNSLLLRDTPTDVYRATVPYLANYTAQIKMITQMRANGLTSEGIQAAMGRSNAYFLVKEAELFPPDEVDRFAEILSAADYQLKTSTGSELLLLEALIVSMCSGPRRRAPAGARYY